MAHRVTLIPGEGTGPEIAEATRRVIEATGVELEWDVQQAGADVMGEHDGTLLPDHRRHRSGAPPNASRRRSPRSSSKARASPTT